MHQICTLSDYLLIIYYYILIITIHANGSNHWIQFIHPLLCGLRYDQPQGLLDLLAILSSIYSNIYYKMLLYGIYNAMMLHTTYYIFIVNYMLHCSSKVCMHCI